MCRLCRKYSVNPWILTCTPWLSCANVRELHVMTEYLPYAYVRSGSPAGIGSPTRFPSLRLCVPAMSTTVRDLHIAVKAVRARASLNARNETQI